MTWRVVYVKRGHFAPDHHDFVYRQAADDWAALCRAGGWEADVCEVPATESVQISTRGNQ